MQLLVISNGHGEDVIAVRIIEQLQLMISDLEITALPIVGEGYAYQNLNIPIGGKVQKMPSGGFVYMSKKQFWADVRGGLLQLTLEQLKIVRKWGKTPGVILAVGDIVPLLFARMSGSDFAFVGTAKSEYYLRDDRGKWLLRTSSLEKWLGSVYLPWERWLMNRAQSVYPRDTLTSSVLQSQKVAAYDMGNPMMDGFTLSTTLNSWQKTLKILLLPGSRQPESLGNWQQILKAVNDIIDKFDNYDLTFYGAIAQGLDITLFCQDLSNNGWHSKANSEKMLFEQRQATLWLSQNAYQEQLQTADLAIAMAGTATEQFVGLGKPVITMAGSGSQCTPAFMEAQNRLLGCSVLWQDDYRQIATTIHFLRDNPQQLAKIAHNGKARMGNPGAAKRIAEHLKNTLLKPNRPINQS